MWRHFPELKYSSRKVASRLCSCSLLWELGITNIIDTSRSYSSKRSFLFGNSWNSETHGCIICIFVLFLSGDYIFTLRRLLPYFDLEASYFGIQWLWTMLPRSKVCARTLYIRIMIIVACVSKDSFIYFARSFWKRVRFSRAESEGVKDRYMSEIDSTGDSSSCFLPFFSLICFIYLRVSVHVYIFVFIVATKALELW